MRPHLLTQPKAGFNDVINQYNVVMLSPTIAAIHKPVTTGRPEGLTSPNHPRVSSKLKPHSVGSK